MNGPQSDFVYVECLGKPTAQGYRASRVRHGLELNRGLHDSVKILKTQYCVLSKAKSCGV